MKARPGCRIKIMNGALKTIDTRNISKVTNKETTERRGGRAAIAANYPAECVPYREERDHYEASDSGIRTGSQNDSSQLFASGCKTEERRDKSPLSR